MKKEKIAKLKITKHSRKKKAANQRGAPAERIKKMRLGRKIIIRYICRDKKVKQVLLKKHSIYIAKIILRKAAIFHMAARGRPLTGYRKPECFI